MGDGGALSARARRLVLFDFDGTLADSFPFFVAVLDELARLHGFSPVRPEQIPLMRRQDARANMRLVGMPAWKLPFVTASFIRLMRERGGTVPLFTGIPETLAGLRAQGLTLALLTSNSVDNAVRTLGPGNARHFDYLEGRSALLGKQGRIRKVLSRSGIPAAQAIYVGDQLSDLRAAHAVGVAFGAVAWGYAELASLREAGADEVFHEVSQLRRLAAGDDRD
ncbi:HAD hydrolase-like protein [Azohydromonas aeria]|uniref:HAD hydrolase-like protein n=1 Tax=Azohydromonas aeria TaxID=2590212 RepID=UPI0012FA5F2B|nr:HAD hydrolase-like protein [Azohydromonas aeria]